MNKSKKWHYATFKAWYHKTLSEAYFVPFSIIWDWKIVWICFIQNIKVSPVFCDDISFCKTFNWIKFVHYNNFTWILSHGWINIIIQLKIFSKLNCFFNFYFVFVNFLLLRENNSSSFLSLYCMSKCYTISNTNNEFQHLFVIIAFLHYLKKMLNR